VFRKTRHQQGPNDRPRGIEKKVVDSILLGVAQDKNRKGEAMETYFPFSVCGSNNRMKDWKKMEKADKAKVLDYASNVLLQLLDTNRDGQVSYQEWAEFDWSNLFTRLNDYNKELDKELFQLLSGEWKFEGNAEKDHFAGKIEFVVPDGPVKRYVTSPCLWQSKLKGEVKRTYPKPAGFVSAKEKLKAVEAQVGAANAEMNQMKALLGETDLFGQEAVDNANTYLGAGMGSLLSSAQDLINTSLKHAENELATLLERTKKAAEEEHYDESTGLLTEMWFICEDVNESSAMENRIDILFVQGHTTAGIFCFGTNGLTSQMENIKAGEFKIELWTKFSADKSKGSYGSGCQSIGTLVATLTRVKQ